jgi:hypothetical protein
VTEKPTFQPLYFSWYPVVESSRDVVSVLLTRGSLNEAPISGLKFAGAVASAAGLDVTPVTFGCDEFVTAYFSGSSESSEQWQECWDVRMLFPEKLRKRAVTNLVRHPVGQAPDSTGMVRAQIPIRVIADFESRPTAKKCESSIREAAHTQSIGWPYRYAIRDVAPHHQQLCIDIGASERPKLKELFADGLAVMKICESLGGRIFASNEP